jgi:hypothetical protein
VGVVSSSNHTLPESNAAACRPGDRIIEYVR